MRRIFTRLYGNEDIKSRLGSAILSGRQNHALLICGPRGSGKHTLAKEIAAALNCENKNKDSFSLPCCTCNTCRRIYEDNYTDIKTLTRDTSKATIGVEELRAFREDMFLSATESEHKIYIIDEADKLTANAQNALLKVLEEPPSNVLILLLSEESDKILTTIKSRSQLITMQRFSAEKIAEYLSNAKIASSFDSARLKNDVMSADGRIGRAIEIIENPAEVEESRKTTLDIISALKAGASYSELYSAIAALPQKRAELLEALSEILLAISDLVKIKLAKGGPLSFFPSIDEAQKISESITLKKLLSVYDALMSTIEDNSKNVNVSALITCLGAKIKLI